MGQNKTTLEIIAPTVEDAVTRGLNQLGVSLEAVDVEILDPGSKGVFGIGGRQARIRLALQNGDNEVEPVSPVEQPREQSQEKQPEKPVRESKASTTEEDSVLKVSRETVQELLEKMKVSAKVSASYTDPEPGEERQVLVDINGDDLSILIGRRSETMNALQYIASLIVSKELEKWVPLVIDIQGYRARRIRQLQQLAHRMADQAVHTGKRQSLEPMPANERRIIHMELSSHDQVITESAGEEPYRKVVILLKK